MMQRFTNPPFEIDALHRTNGKEEMGIDMESWEVFLLVRGERLLHFVQFDQLTKWTKEARPEIYNYISSVRSGIPGMGPKHSKMFEHFDDESFDFEPLIKEYLEQAVDIEAVFEWNQRIRQAAPQQQEQLQEKVDNLSSHFPAMKASASKWEEYADSLMEYTTRRAIEIYPEIAEGDAEHIRALRDRLVRGVHQLADEISKVAYEASNGNKGSAT